MEKFSKASIIATLAIIFFFFGREHFTSTWLLHFQHANIFHLLANCWAIFLFKKPAWIPAYLIATASAIPFQEGEMIGFSGVLFAALGWVYGRYPSRRLWWAAAIIIITGLLPDISAAYHLITLFAGFFCGYIFQIIVLYVKYRNR